MKRKRVHIEVRNGWLKLRCSYQGRRYDLALGLPDGALNRKIAERKATEIEIDITTATFDATLSKYRPEQPSQPSGLSVAGLFQKFMRHKASEVYPPTLIKYDATLKRLREFFKEGAAAAVTLEQAEAFRAWFAARINPSTQQPNSYQFKE